MSWLALLADWWHAPSAWSIAAGCVALAARQLRKLRRVVAPLPKQLLAELQEEAAGFGLDDEQRRRAMVAELNQRLSDVSFELGLMPARFTALTRIALAGSTGLALFGYIGSSDRPALERVAGLAICALAGLSGAVGVLFLGRMAKDRARATREAWDRSSRETGTAIGASLERRAGERKRGAERAS